MMVSVILKTMTFWGYPEKLCIEDWLVNNRLVFLVLHRHLDVVVVQVDEPELPHGEVMAVDWRLTAATAAEWLDNTMQTALGHGGKHLATMSLVWWQHVEDVGEDVGKHRNRLWWFVCLPVWSMSLCTVARPRPVVARVRPMFATRPMSMTHYYHVQYSTVMYCQLCTTVQICIWTLEDKCSTTRLRCHLIVKLV